MGTLVSEMFVRKSAHVPSALVIKKVHCAGGHTGKSLLHFEAVTSAYSLFQLRMYSLAIRAAFVSRLMPWNSLQEPVEYVEKSEADKLLRTKLSFRAA